MCINGFPFLPALQNFAQRINKPQIKCTLSKDKIIAVRNGILTYERIPSQQGMQLQKVIDQTYHNTTSLILSLFHFF